MNDHFQEATLDYHLIQLLLLRILHILFVTTIHLYTQNILHPVVDEIHVSLLLYSFDYLQSINYTKVNQINTC